MNKSSAITPVILSGGSGTRLWPMSRQATPKQFLALAEEATMFESTLARVADGAQFADPLIVANARHRALIDAQLKGRAATLLLEPCAKNTAPAIALAALALPGDAAMLVMPSDHVVADVPAFHAAIAAALPLVADGWLVACGIAPQGPETGYGYIRMGEALAGGLRRIDRFVEKPDLASAQAMLAEGGYAWNGGIFLFRADAYLGALSVHAPDMLHAAQQAMAKAQRDGNVILPDEAAFAACPSDSIDYAVMEKAERRAVVPVSMGWSDLGSWDALYDIAAKDAGGTATGGDVIALDTKNCLIRSDGLRVTTVGIEDLIIIASGDSLLILPRGESQNVKRIVEVLPDSAR